MSAPPPPPATRTTRSPCGEFDCDICAELDAACARCDGTGEVGIAADESMPCPGCGGTGLATQSAARRK